MTRLISLLLSIGLIVGFCINDISAMPALAQENIANFRFEPPTLQIGLNQVEKVNLVLENAHEIYALDLRGTFDPNVVEVVDMDAQQDGIQMVPGSFPKPDFVVRNTADNEAGTFMYVLTQVNPTLPVSGNGIVLTIYFRGKSNGQSSQFAINFVESSDRRGNKMPVQPGEVVLSVVAPKPPTPTLPAQVQDTEFANEQNSQDSGAQPTAPSGAQQTDYSQPVGAPGRVTPQAAAMPGANDSSNSHSKLLQYIALGGFGGAALIILAAMIIIFRRRSAAAKTPAQ